MLKKEEKYTTPVKKIRFRGDLTHQFNETRTEDVGADETNMNDETDSSSVHTKGCSTKVKTSIYDFVKLELTRGYALTNDFERYSARREKIYSFMKIPREVEKFLAYGFLQCADSFLFIFTFLPVRYVAALWRLFTRWPLRLLRRPRVTPLTQAEICDLLKMSLWIAVCVILIYSFDTNKLYHMIKSQSIIKLYIFYNMLEVGDRLLSAFGQDTIDALSLTATEPKRDSRTRDVGLPGHILFAFIYVFLHSGLIMIQATTLNVAINSNNKGLLTIMMSNNFVEIKGSVFKKFDKNNLFQLTCSDVRERFHLVTLLLIVVVQTMREYNWHTEQFLVMLPCCLYVLCSEFFVDWIKHAFITRFNEIPSETYHEYTVSLAYDMTQTRQKHAFSDPSDLLARRMGFIPFPLGIVLTKAFYHAVTCNNVWVCTIIILLVYLFLMTCRIVITICALGKACDLMSQHEQGRMANQMPPTPNQPKTFNTSDVATSPMHINLQRSQSQIIDSCTSTMTEEKKPLIEDELIRTSEHLGATAIFSNSDVDLEYAQLNEKILTLNGDEPSRNEDGDEVGHRTHRRSESEPSIQIETKSTSNDAL